MTTVAEANPPSGPQGLGGWMILPILGMGVSPLLILAGFGPHVTLVSSGAIYRLSAALQTFIWIEIALNILLIVGWIYALVLCLAWSEKFPKTYIAVLTANLGVQAADLLVASAFFDHQMTPQDFWDLGRGALTCLIWIPYMLHSQRVRNTFYRGAAAATDERPSV
jgi:hypothetical protein